MPSALFGHLKVILIIRRYEEVELETDLEVLVGDVALGAEAELVQELLERLRKDLSHRNLLVDVLHADVGAELQQLTDDRLRPKLESQELSEY